MNDNDEKTVIPGKLFTDEEARDKVVEAGGEAVETLLNTSSELAEDVSDEDIQEVPISEEESIALMRNLKSEDVPVMRCGHIASSAIPHISHTGESFIEFGCVLCLENEPMFKQLLGPRGQKIAITRKDLAGRVARCLCKKEIPSDTAGVTFLHHIPTKKDDFFYCGHAGFEPEFVKTVMDRGAGKKVISIKRKSLKMKKWHK